MGIFQVKISGEEVQSFPKKEKDEQKTPKFDFAGTMSYSWNMGWEGGEVMGSEAGKAGRCQSQEV